MREYKVTIFDDTNNRVYEANIQARTMFGAEKVAIAECVEMGFHIDRIFTEGRV